MLIENKNYKYEINGKSVEIVGLAELGVPQETYDNTYVEDHDNQVDIIVKGDLEIIENIKKLNFEVVKSEQTVMIET